MKIELLCAFCRETFTTEIELLGWAVRYSSIGEEHAFCPKHALVEDFFSAQCTGCVGGWSDCSFHRDLYSEPTRIEEKDMAMIRSGFCPRRTNGSFMLGPSAGGRLESFNISDQASAESGEALVNAILDLRAYLKQIATREK